MFLAVVVEALNGCLQQPDASVVAKLPDIGSKFRDVVKHGLVTAGRKDFQFRCLIEDHLSLKIAYNKGNGLSKITVRRVSDQSGTGVGFGVD